MLVRAGVGWKPGVVKHVVVSSEENSPEGLTLKDGAVISPDFRREQRFAYHDFLIDHGVQAFVNVLILGGKGRPPFGVLQVDSRSPRGFTSRTYNSCGVTRTSLERQSTASAPLTS